MGQMQRTSETDIQKQPPTAFVLPSSKTELFLLKEKKVVWPLSFYLTNTSFENFLISAAGKSHPHCYRAQCGGRGTMKNAQTQKERQQQQQKMWFMM